MGKLTVIQLSVCWVWIWDGKAWSIKLCCICAQQWEEQRQWHTLANHVVLLGVKTNKQQTFIIMLHISFSKQYSITLHRNGLFLTQAGYSIYIHTHTFFFFAHKWTMTTPFPAMNHALEPPFTSSRMWPHVASGHNHTHIQTQHTHRVEDRISDSHLIVWSALRAFLVTLSSTVVL